MLNKIFMETNNKVKYEVFMPLANKSTAPTRTSEEELEIKKLHEIGLTNSISAYIKEHKVESKFLQGEKLQILVQWIIRRFPTYNIPNFCFDEFHFYKLFPIEVGQKNSLCFALILHGSHQNWVWSEREYHFYSLYGNCWFDFSENDYTGFLFRKGFFKDINSAKNIFINMKTDEEIKKIVKNYRSAITDATLNYIKEHNLKSEFFYEEKFNLLIEEIMKNIPQLMKTCSYFENCFVHRIFLLENEEKQGLRVEMIFEGCYFDSFEKNYSSICIEYLWDSEWNSYKEIVSNSNSSSTSLLMAQKVLNKNPTPEEKKLKIEKQAAIEKQHEVCLTNALSKYIQEHKLEDFELLNGEKFEQIIQWLVKKIKNDQNHCSFHNFYIHNIFLLESKNKDKKGFCFEFTCEGNRVSYFDYNKIKSGFYTYYTVDWWEPFLNNYKEYGTLVLSSEDLVNSNGWLKTPRVWKDRGYFQDKKAYEVEDNLSISIFKSRALNSKRRDSELTMVISVSSKVYFCKLIQLFLEDKELYTLKIPLSSINCVKDRNLKNDPNCKFLIFYKLPTQGEFKYDDWSMEDILIDVDISIELTRDSMVEIYGSTAYFEYLLSEAESNAGPYGAHKLISYGIHFGSYENEIVSLEFYYS